MRRIHTSRVSWSLVAATVLGLGSSFSSEAAGEPAEVSASLFARGKPAALSSEEARRLAPSVVAFVSNGRILRSSEKRPRNLDIPGLLRNGTFLEMTWHNPLTIRVGDSDIVIRKALIAVSDSGADGAYYLAGVAAGESAVRPSDVPDEYNAFLQFENREGIKRLIQAIGQIAPNLRRGAR